MNSWISEVEWETLCQETPPKLHALTYYSCLSGLGFLAPHGMEIFSAEIFARSSFLLCRSLSNEASTWDQTWQKRAVILWELACFLYQFPCSLFQYAGDTKGLCHIQFVPQFGLNSRINNPSKFSESFCHLIKIRKLKSKYFSVL